MTEKNYLSKEELFRRLLEGADKLQENVGATMGPRGRNVILKEKGEEGESEDPIITKDGVTVAKFVDYRQDPFVDSAIQILKQAAIETNKNAGDGTTTATVIAHSILDQARTYTIPRLPTEHVREGLQQAKETVLEYLEGHAKPIEDKDDIENIATISSNNTESIGEMVATAVHKVGKDGHISVEEGKTLDTVLDFVEGFRMNEGYITSDFITEERNRTAFHKEPLIVATDHVIRETEQVMKPMEKAAAEEKPLIIVAEDIEEEALALLVYNHINDAADIAAIRAPGFGEQRREHLKDLCVNVGATFVSKEKGQRVQDVSMADMGTCDSVTIKAGKTTFIGGKGRSQDIKDRIESLKTEVEEVEDIRKAEEIQSRITRLTSGVAVIKVGGATKVEKVEKKHKIEDALEAVRSAQDEGVLPGGGSMLYRASCEISPAEFDQKGKRTGAQIMKDALRAPIRQMSSNADMSPDLVFSLLEEQDSIEYGFDFLKGEIVNMTENGIIDPFVVTKTAIDNAVSAASTLLTANHAIVED